MIHQPLQQLRITGVVYELATGEQLRITARGGKDGSAEVVRVVIEPQALGPAGAASRSKGTDAAGEEGKR